MERRLMKGDAKKERVKSKNGTEDAHCSTAMSFSESLWDKDRSEDNSFWAELKRMLG